MTGWVRAALDRTIRLVKQDIFPTLDDETIFAALTGTRVKLVADAANLATPAGQTAFVTTAVLTAQMGASLILDIMEMAIAGRQPPLGEGGTTND